MAILLMDIDGYSINDYWWLLVAIDGYYINGYWLLLMTIDGYSINDYWSILYYKLLLIILCYIMTVGDYFIINYC
jgi:hypothetical protein